MARFVTGNTFGTTDTVTSTTLNNAVNNAAISTDSVDNSTIEVNSNALRLKDVGVTTAKIANNAVTLAKMATQADQTVLGNVSGGTAVPTAVPIVGAAGILVNNDSLGTDDTKGATQGNIKAFVENLIGTADKSGSGVVTEGTQGSITLGGGLIVKFGSVDVNTTSVTLTFKDSSGNNSPFPTAIYGVMVSANENFSTAAESVSASGLALGSCTVRGYASSSGSAAGRVFFIAIGH